MTQPLRYVVGPDVKLKMTQVVTNPNLHKPLPPSLGRGRVGFVFKIRRRRDTLRPPRASHVRNVGTAAPQQGHSGFGDGLRSRAADAVEGGLRRKLQETAIAIAARSPGTKPSGHRLQGVHSNVRMHTDRRTTHTTPTTSVTRMMQNTGYTHRLHRTHIQTASTLRPSTIRLQVEQAPHVLPAWANHAVHGAHERPRYDDERAGESTPTNQRVQFVAKSFALSELPSRDSAKKAYA